MSVVDGLLVSCGDLVGCSYASAIKPSDSSSIGHPSPDSFCWKGGKPLITYHVGSLATGIGLGTGFSYLTSHLGSLQSSRFG